MATQQRKSVEKVQLLAGTRKVIAAICSENRGGMMQSKVRLEVEILEATYRLGLGFYVSWAGFDILSSPKDIMDQKYQLPFKAGQTAEARSFEVGFRGAWFRCKIKEISCRRGHWNALLEYFDYPDEKWTWTELYQVPPYQSGKSKEIRQLILRPEYPPIHSKNKVSDVSSNSDVTIAVVGTWEAGDLVDWWNADCYWSGKVTKLLNNGKAEIELVPPPLGEGETYEVFVKDMRPSLDWSPEFGWAVPATLDGESSCQYSQLLKLVIQGHAIGEGRRNRQATSGLSSNSSFSTRLSGNLPPNENRDFKTAEFVDSKDAANRSMNMLNQTASSSAHRSAKSLPALDDKRDSESKELVEQFLNIAQSKEAANISKASVWSGSDSSAPIRDDASTSGEIQFNSLESNTVEDAILDLEELANKISWLKQIMECGRPLSDAVTPSWKFLEHSGTSTHN